MPPPNPLHEWSLPHLDGAGPSGTVSGIRTRREHALLVSRDAAGRVFALVNGFDAWASAGNASFRLTSQRYAPGHIEREGLAPLLSFSASPWPTWTFRLGDATRLTQEITAVPGRALVACRWRLLDDAKDVRVRLRPFLSGRELSATHLRNEAFRTAAETRGWKTSWRPYDAVPDVSAYCAGRYDHEPHWYERFQYPDGSCEDLVAPGVFSGPVAPASPFEIVFAAGWEEVVQGMILPEDPVLWAERASRAGRRGSKRGVGGGQGRRGSKAEGRGSKSGASGKARSSGSSARERGDRSGGGGGPAAGKRKGS